MRKLISILTCAAALLLLVACGGGEKPAGEIKLKELTPEAEEALELIRHPGMDMHILSYYTEDPFVRSEVWVEIYEYGKLVNTSGGLGFSRDAGGPMRGDIAVIINTTDGYRVTLVDNRGAMKASSTSEAIPVPAYGCAFGPNRIPETIEDGKEIILYSTIYNKGQVTAYDQQRYAEEPELLDENDMSILVKCRFTK